MARIAYDDVDAAAFASSPRPSGCWIPPGVALVEASFATAGFATVSLAPVPQVAAASLSEAAASLRREAHTPLKMTTDDGYAAGIARLSASAGGSSPTTFAADPSAVRRTTSCWRADYIRRYRDWSIANRPKATNPSATAVSRNLPNGCARIVCSAPSSPCAFCRSKVSVA